MRRTATAGTDGLFAKWTSSDFQDKGPIGKQSIFARTKWRHHLRFVSKCLRFTCDQVTVQED